MSASLISWIVSLFFILIIAVGFFIGMWRGIKHSTLNIILSVVGVVVAFFVTPLITDALLGIQIPINNKTIPLSSLALELVLENPETAEFVANNPNLQAFLIGLPKAIINVVLFIFVVVSIESILYIVYKILAKTVFKVKHEEKKHRVAGGIVGAVKTLIVVVIAAMPLSALIGTASTCLNLGDYGITSSAEQVSMLEEETEGQNEAKKDRGIIANAVPEVVVEIVDGLENNLLTKISGLFGLDNAMFDYYGNFEVAEQKIVLREEVENIYNIVDISMQLSKIDATYSFKDFNYDKISKEFEKLSKSPMFKNILAQTLGQIIMDYKDHEFIAESQFALDYEEVLDAISSGLKDYTTAGGNAGEYFTDDVYKLAGIATLFGESGAIDDIMQEESLDISKALSVLTSNKYYETFKSGLDKLFEMNIVRDSLTEIANKFIPQLSADVDKIGVSTAAWTDADWQNISTSVASIVKDYADVAEKISILDVLNDATLLLDKQKNYDISGILTKLGNLIDEARAVNLLKTQDGKPIIDKLLTKHNMPLPANPVVKNNGEIITISTYGGEDGLFDFIAPSLVKIRDNQIYELVTNSDSANQKMISLAQIVSIEGNQTLLSEIIMPLYQVEPTKTLIVNQLTSGLNSSLIDFSKLEKYEDWKSDLDYISVILKTLNSKKTVVEGQEKTYLQLVIDGKFAEAVDNMKQNEIDEVIKPIFYAKSTSAVKTSILSTIEKDLKAITGDNSLTLSADGITFIDGAYEDQAQELCNILKEILPLKEDLADIQNMNKQPLGHMLNTMKSNAYRVQLSESIDIPFEEDGIFKSAFVSLMAKLKEEYETEVAYLESQPDMLEEQLGVRSLAEENYVRIDFAELMTLIDLLEQ